MSGCTQLDALTARILTTSMLMKSSLFVSTAQLGFVSSVTGFMNQRVERLLKFVNGSVLSVGFVCAGGLTVQRLQPMSQEKTAHIIFVQCVS